MFSCFKDKDFLKRFLKISLPVMLAQFITFFTNFLDNIMVGTVSNEAVSGVYAANQVTYLFQMASFGIVEGAGIFIQQFAGAKDNERIKQSFRYKLLVSIILLIVVMPIVYYFGKYLVSFFSKSDSNYEAIYNEGVNYLYVVALSYIPFAISECYSTSLREIGKTKYAMISAIIAVISNFIFNAIFIIGLDLGALGAAYATIIARILEMLFLIIISIIMKFSFSYGAFKGFKIEANLFKKITGKGWLLFINELGYAAGTMLQSLAFSQRDGVLSSISIVSTLSSILGVLITGISVGIGVMVGSDLGADDFEKAKDDNKKLNLLGFYLTLFLGIILILSSKGIPYMFTEVTESQKALATKLIIIYGSLLWANTLSVSSYFTLKVGGQSTLTFLLDTGTMVLLYIPISWSLALFTDLDIIYIYLIVRSLDLLKALLGVTLMRQYKWVNNLTKIDKEVPDEVY